MKTKKTTLFFAAFLLAGSISVHAGSRFITAGGSGGMAYSSGGSTAPAPAGRLRGHLTKPPVWGDNIHTYG